MFQSRFLTYFPIDLAGKRLAKSGISLFKQFFILVIVSFLSLRLMNAQIFDLKHSSFTGRCCALKELIGFKFNDLW